MIHVEISYDVPDVEGYSFKPVEEIVKEIRREFWNNRLFSEASGYKITVYGEEYYATANYLKTEDELNDKTQIRTVSYRSKD
jgi:hypothetical protein